MPAEEIEKRQEKIRQEARKRARIPSKELLELAQWSIYITNVPFSPLKDEQIAVLYGLRWQIELFFKLCKSEAGIAQLNSKKPDRVKCSIYAKLISVVILLFISLPIRWQETQELSWPKAYRYARYRANDFFQALQSPYRLRKFLKAFLDDLKDFALKDRYRKKKPSTYKKLMATTGQEVLI